MICASTISSLLPRTDSMTERIRFVDDIGMFAFSRGKYTCRWQTKWCEKRCYNRKFYQVNPKLVEVDEADNFWWNSLSIKDFLKKMAKVGVKDRFRFAVRGEIWNTVEDIMMVREILLARKDVLFWIPTRAWRSLYMYSGIHRYILPLMNARAMASIDPMTNPLDIMRLQDDGWRLLFAGDNYVLGQCLLAPNGEAIRDKRDGWYRCPKTWLDESGACVSCTKGCFNPKRVDVHLKQHR